MGDVAATNSASAHAFAGLSCRQSRQTLSPIRKRVMTAEVSNSPPTKKIRKVRSSADPCMRSAPPCPHHRCPRPTSLTASQANVSDGGWAASNVVARLNLRDASAVQAHLLDCLVRDCIQNCAIPYHVTIVRLI